MNNWWKFEETLRGKSGKPVNLTTKQRPRPLTLLLSERPPPLHMFPPYHREARRRSTSRTISVTITLLWTENLSPWKFVCQHGTRCGSFDSSDDPIIQTCQNHEFQPGFFHAWCSCNVTFSGEKGRPGKRMKPSFKVVLSIHTQSVLTRPLILIEEFRRWIWILQDEYRNPIAEDDDSTFAEEVEDAYRDGTQICCFYLCRLRIRRRSFILSGLWLQRKGKRTSAN